MSTRERHRSETRDVVPFRDIEGLRHNTSLSAALTGITAAVVGVIANLSVFFSIHTLFTDTQIHDVLRSELEELGDEHRLACLDALAPALQAALLQSELCNPPPHLAYHSPN